MAQQTEILDGERKILANIVEEQTSCDEGAHERGQWGAQMEFALSCIGFSVGIGNILRFPYLCVKHGGGAFLVPYLLFLIICGMPLFFMELVVGQSTGLSTVRAFSKIPFFQGIGWCMVAVSAILCIYFNIFIAWILYYIGMSFNWTLPWGHCNNSWNTPQCFTHETQENYTTTTGPTLNASNSNLTKISSSEEFWLHNVLEISDSIENIGGVNRHLLLAMIAAWILTFLCMYKGIRSSGKVVYVTATAPYILLTVILVRGVTLPGAWEGVKLYIVPEWSRLADITVWSDAATQIFFSLGPAWGSLMTFASYNRYNHRVMRDAMIIPIICALTSLYGGFAIFSVIGHLMYITESSDTTQFIKQGPGLAFVAYPQALIKLPGGPVWSVLFFLTLLTIGIDSQFATLETVITGLVDRFPNVVGKYRLTITLCICLVEFGLGFILVTRAGFYYFELLDDLSTAFSVTVIGFLESITFAYFYGARRLLKDAEDMRGKICVCLRCWWLTTWLVLVPIFTMAVIIVTLVKYAQNWSYYLDKYPLWAFAFGWCIAMMSFVEFPICAIIAVVRNRCNWRKVFQFSDSWRIAIKDRQEVYAEDTTEVGQAEEV